MVELAVLRACMLALVAVSTARGFTLTPAAPPRLSALTRSQPAGLRCLLALGGAGRVGTLGAMAIVGKAKVVLPPPPALFSSQWFVAASVALFSVAQGLPALIVASALVSLIGFIRYSWFFSLGYGLSMSVMAAMCVLYMSSTSSAIAGISLLHAALVFAWGVRLALFLAYREFVAWPDAKKRNEEITKKMSFPSKFATWCGVVVFDALLFSPVLFGLKTPSKLPLLTYLGVAAQAVGLVIETVADAQKTAHRRRTNTFVSGGLYKYSRHPNYLGEIVFWVGTYIAGVGSLCGVAQSIFATLGLVAILGVMNGATNNLDKRQMLKYRGTNGFEEYLQTTPKLLPFTRGEDPEKIETILAKAAEEVKTTKGTRQVGMYKQSDTVTLKKEEIQTNYEKKKSPWDL